MDFTVIIPARMHSTRLPNKVLLPINNKPMIEHVVDRAKQSGASKIIVATDHVDIQQWAQSCTVDCVMTDEKHPNGTTRVKEVIDSLQLNKNIPIVAIQADEPAINPQLIKCCAEKISEYQADDLVMVTAADPLQNHSQLLDKQTVKVILNKNDEAMYFSRAAVGNEFVYKDINAPVLKHIGIYAYYPEYLEQYLSWPMCELEQIERLEQLRALYNGAMMPTIRFNEATGFGVDTEQDYLAMCEYLNN